MTGSNPGDSTNVRNSPVQSWLPFGSSALRTPPAQELTSASSYADLNYLFGVQNTAMIAPKANRNRRKSSQGSEHTKHRRTRSGCYTCRNRRVKCDEGHPICERCKKGGRECVYPEPTASSKTSSSGQSKLAKAKSRESTGSSSDDNEEDCESERLEVIPDGDESIDGGTASSTQAFPKPSTSQNSINQASSQLKAIARQESETPSLVQDKGASPTPSTEGSTGYTSYQAQHQRSTKTSVSSASGSEAPRSDWSHLPSDLQFYLAYFCENLTQYHYSLKCTSDTFLQTHVLDAALRNNALLYAIVGFSAFQRTLQNPQGKIQDFLQYYNKAVSLLLHSLKKGERRTTSTIMAILQLATIEEYLGDWINLLGHQKAAYEILLELYTPETVMEKEATRIMLGWYMRFDVFAGLLGGFETVLSREWFAYAGEFYQKQSEIEPEKLTWKIDTWIALHRLLAMDISLLFAKKGKREISKEQFLRENEVIGQRIVEWKTKMDPALQDSRYMVTDFTGARPRDPLDIVDPYIPGALYSGPLFVMNVAVIDWYSIDLMHKYQTALTLNVDASEEISKNAFQSLQLFEAVEYWPGSPPGAIMACQASLGISSIFLPRDERHSNWVRRKLATIECNGYIYPYTFRTKMADIFRDRSCMHWWLPDEEDYPPIIRTIRNFVEERTSVAKDVPTEDLRDMKAIFASLKLSDDESSIVPTRKRNMKEPHISVAVATNQDTYEQMRPMGAGGGY